MKKLILNTLILLFGISTVNAQLSAGDIAFIGFNTDDPEGFSFITLTNIPGNEEIYFTDAGIVNSTAWGTIEENWLFTAPAAGIPCGTIISCVEQAIGSNSFTISGVSGATMIWESGSATPNINLGPGDNFIAYQTSAGGFPTSPAACTFIAGIHTNYDPATIDATSSWTQSAFVTSTPESALPPGLTNGVNCLSFNVNPGPEYDNFKYTGTLTGSSSALRTSINDYNNWILTNTASYGINPSDYASPSVTCAAPCTNPDVPTITSGPGTICAGNSALLTITGAKNDATQWVVYTGSCGGTQVATTVGSTVIVTPTPPGTTYFVRGEGGCVTPGSCGTITVNTTPLQNASFSYGAASYCPSASDPTPTVTGATGGLFSASPSGLALSTSTGTIDASASTPGTYTVTYTTSGLCSNSSNVSVTIGDVIPPTAICQNINVYLDATGTVSIVASDLDGGSSDNCGSVTLSASSTSFSCLTLGANNVTLTVTDLAGNTATCTAIVTVADTISPVAVCQNITAYLDGSGTASIVAADIDGGSTDNCGAVTLSASTTAFTCADIGPNNVNLTVTDGSSNISSCTATVTIVDTISPVVVCNSGTQNISDDGIGDCTFTPFVFGQGGSYDISDNCSGSLTVQEFFTGALNTTSTFTLGQGTGYTPVQPFPVGVTNVTIIVTDASGNSDSCSYTTTIIDDEAPTASCQNITVFLDGAGTADIVAADIDNGSTDNCSAVTLSASTTTFTCADLGPNSVTLTVTDGSGNTSTCTATVTVADTVAPVASCQNITVFLDGAGNASIAAADLNNGSTDNCSAVTFSASQTAFTCVDLGPNNVTLTVTDGSSNISSCTATVTIVDTISPTITCPGNQIEAPNAACQFTLPDYTSLASTSDNCSSLTLTQSPTPGTVISTNTTLTLTANDGNGNSDQCTFDVFLNDAIPPTAVCQNITAYLDGSGTASIVAADIDGGSTDNCGAVTLSASTTAFTCADIGPNNVNLTVTDGSSNISSCTATVTIVDTISPVVVCNSGTQNISDDGIGDCTFTPFVFGQGGSYDISDNCSGSLTVQEFFTGALNTTSTFTLGQGTGYTPVQPFPVGVTNVTVIVTDASGNSDSCSYTTTILDDEAPTASCQNITVFLDGAGTADIVAADIDNGSTDNCSAVTLSASTTTFTCADLGPNSVTLTVTDGSGNTSTCTATVTVADTVAPVASCQNITVFLDGAGNASIAAADLNNGSTDNCGTVTFSASQTAFTCADIGPNNVNLTVTDGSSNISSCTATVTIVDTISPVVLCNSGTQNISDDGIGDCTFTPFVFGQGGSYDISDNCSGSLTVQEFFTGALNTTSTFTLGQGTGYTPVQPFPVGVTNVTVIVTDASGNSDSCSYTTTIIDDEAPTASCQNITVFLDGAGTADIVAADIDNGSADNCSAVTLSANQTAFTCADAGSNNVTLTVTDAAGNASSCIAVVTILDTVPPTAICQNITAYLDGTGNVSIVPADIDGGSTDNCGAVTFSASQTAFTCADIGPNNVTLTVTDAAGNSTSCVAVVSIVDTISPIAICQNITAYLDGAGNASIVAADIDGGSTDNCGSVTLSASTTTFTCADIGPTNVILTVSDANTNSSACTAVVTIVDTISPVAICQNISAYLDGSGNASILAADIDGGSTDNCGSVTLSASTTTFTCVNVGSNNVTLTVTDAAGNASSCIAVVTILDTVPPAAICQNITAYLDGTGNVSIVPADIDGGSTDNCGTVTLSASVTAFTCADVGPNNVTLTVTDANTNSASCAAIVTIVDTIAPVATCQNITVYLDGAGNASIVAADIDGGSTDNCATVTLSASTTTFTCADIGPNNVTLTVTDANANSTSCVAVVSIVDTISPVAICQNITAYLDGTGNTSFVAADIDGSSSDNCGPLTLSASTTAFTCNDVGPNNVTLTVTDANSNSSACITIVTVVDTIAPVAICQNISAYLDGAGNASIVAADIDGGSTDNCGAVNLSVSQTTFTCSAVGPNNITLTVTDANGNTSTCIAVVTVIDTIAPAAVCQNITAYLDALGNASIIAADIDGGSSDNCTPVTISASQTTFDCSDLGPNNVTLSVSDGNSNVSSCIATVSVQDTIAPVITTCPGNQVEYLNGSCVYVLPDYTSGVVASDNCASPPNITQSPAPGSSIGGNTTITMTANDGNGNTVQCSFTISVSDTLPPVSLCQNIDLYLNGSGNAGINVVDINAGSFDNCTPIVLTASQISFSCAQIGPNNVTLTSDDLNGNSSTCVAVVSVIDTISPVVTCLGNLTVTPNANCQFTLPDYSLSSNFNVTDNCSGLVTVSQVPAPGTVIGFGVQTISLTADDGSGNTATCSFDVTVVPSNITASQTLVECAGFSITINGNTYDSTGIYTDVLVGAAANGCDSTLTTDLTVLPALSGSFSATICTGESIIINGTVYNSLNLTGTEVFTNIGANNCDSTVSVSLTLISIDNTVTNASPTVTANQSGASYQWLDCDNGFAIIPGANSQSFTATSTGNYAVQITSGICVDTSACESVIGTGIRDQEILQVNMYPNPTNGVVFVELDRKYTASQMTVYNMIGKAIIQQEVGSSFNIDLSNYSQGVYIVKIQNGTKSISKRVFKK